MTQLVKYGFCEATNLESNC